MPTTLLNRPNTDSIVCRRNRPSLNRESVDEVVMYETNIFELLYPVYAIQPVWEPVEKRVGQPVECLYIHDTTGCPTGCQPVWQPVGEPIVSCMPTFNRLSNRLHNRLYRVNGILRLLPPLTPNSQQCCWAIEELSSFLYSLTFSVPIRNFASRSSKIWGNSPPG